MANLLVSCGILIVWVMAELSRLRFSHKFDKPEIYVIHFYYLAVFKNIFDKIFVNFLHLVTFISNY